MKMKWNDALLAILALGIVVALIGSCTTPDYRPEGSSIPSGSNRFIDEEAGVVCWTHGAQGIDCLPIESTKLKGGSK